MECLPLFATRSSECNNWVDPRGPQTLKDRVLRPDVIEPGHLCLHGRKTEIVPAILDDVVDVAALLQETETFGEGYRADHVEGEHLQPEIQRTRSLRLHEPAIHLLEKTRDGAVDHGLIGYHACHGVDACNGLPQQAVNSSVLSGKQTGNGFSFEIERQYPVEIGFEELAVDIVDCIDFRRSTDGYHVGAKADDGTIATVKFGVNVAGVVGVDP